MNQASLHQADDARSGLWSRDLTLRLTQMTFLSRTPVNAIFSNEEPSFYLRLLNPRRYL
jgi:hypothetical protein